MLLSEQYNQIVINMDNRPEADIVGNVKQFSNTSLNDWIDAQFVMEKGNRWCCLWSELDNFIGRKLESFSESEQLSFEGYYDSEGFTSVEAIRLQKHYCTIPMIVMVMQMILLAAAKSVMTQVANQVVHSLTYTSILVEKRRLESYCWVLWIHSSTVREYQWNCYWISWRDEKITKEWCPNWKREALL